MRTLTPPPQSRVAATFARAAFVFFCCAEAGGAPDVIIRSATAALE
jgi:hypothetical protein